MPAERFLGEKMGSTLIPVKTGARKTLPDPKFGGGLHIFQLTGQSALALTTHHHHPAKTSASRSLSST